MAERLLPGMETYRKELVKVLDKVMQEKQKEANTISQMLEPATPFYKREYTSLLADPLQLRPNMAQELAEAEEKQAFDKQEQERVEAFKHLKADRERIYDDTQDLLKLYEKELTELKSLKNKLESSELKLADFLEIAYIVAHLTDSDIYNRILRAFPHLTATRPVSKNRFKGCTNLYQKYQDLQRRYEQCQGGEAIKNEKLKQALASVESKKDKECKQTLDAFNEQYASLAERCSTMHADTSSSSQTLRSQIVALERDLEHTRRECQRRIEALKTKQPTFAEKKELYGRLLRCQTQRKSNLRYMELYGSLKERCEKGMQDLTGFFISKMNEKLHADGVPNEWQQYIGRVARFAGDSLQHEAKRRLEALHRHSETK